MAEMGVSEVKAALAGATAENEVLEGQLAMLLGRNEPLPDWSRPGTLPVLGMVGLDQVPADLLRTRPDIAAAEARVLKAAGEAGEARANLLPRLGIGGSVVWSTNLTTHRQTQDNALLTLGPMIDIPCSIGARVRPIFAPASTSSRPACSYRQAVLEGVADVEAALARLQQQAARQAEQGAAHAALVRALQAQDTRAAGAGGTGRSDPSAMGCRSRTWRASTPRLRAIWHSSACTRHWVARRCHPRLRMRRLSADGRVGPQDAVARMAPVPAGGAGGGICRPAPAAPAALVLGIFSSASIYVTGSTADLWVGYPGPRASAWGEPSSRMSKCTCGWTRRWCGSSHSSGSMPIGAARAEAAASRSMSPASIRGPMPPWPTRASSRRSSACGWRSRTR
jgi:hypothetical protein